MDNTNIPRKTEEEYEKELRALKRQLRQSEYQLRRNQAVLATYNNVNDMFSAEQRKLQNNMNLLLENSPDSMLLFDQGGYLSYCTASFLKAIGAQSPGVVSGLHFTSLFERFAPPDWIASISARYREAIESCNTVVFDDIVGLSAAQGPRSFNISIAPMRDEGGAPIGALMLFHDQTDIVTAMEAANNANAAKSNFLATMSHEMRTPMNAIIGMTRIAKFADDAERVYSSLDKIEEASNHLLSVINDILDMSKIEAGKFDLDPVTFHFPKSLRATVDVLAQRMEEKRQRFSLEIDPEITPLLYGDEKHLMQVVTNLLSNAVKFTPEGGEITVEAKSNGMRGEQLRLAISVRDTGIGISAEKQAQLFKPFSQADASITRRFGGTGLGLAISQRIINMMGGEIQVDSRDGMGARFHFEVHMELADAKSATREYDKLDIDAIDWTGKTILLVEDIEINREIIQSLLEDTHVAIDMAENGQIAVSMMEDDPTRYDLILMDIQMPVLDGFGATQQIRQIPDLHAQRIPILAMTANAFREDVEACLRAGMDGHIPKPIEVDDLFRQINKYFAGA